MRQDPVRALPVRDRQVHFVFQKVTERIANGPRAADQLPYPLLAAQPAQPRGVISSQRVIVPTNCAAHLHVVGVDSAGGVMGGRNPARYPVIEPAKLPQACCERPHTGAGLAFQLHQIKLGNASLRPEVRRQANLRGGVAVQIKRQTLDGARAEIPTGDDALRRYTAKRFRHGHWLLSREKR